MTEYYNNGPKIGLYYICNFFIQKIVLSLRSSTDERQRHCFMLAAFFAHLCSSRLALQRKSKGRFYMIHWWKLGLMPSPSLLNLCLKKSHHSLQQIRKANSSKYIRKPRRVNKVCRAADKIFLDMPCESLLNRILFYILLTDVKLHIDTRLLTINRWGGGH